LAKWSHTPSDGVNNHIGTRQANFIEFVRRRCSPGNRHAVQNDLLTQFGRRFRPYFYCSAFFFLVDWNFERAPGVSLRRASNRLETHGKYVTPHIHLCNSIIVCSHAHPLHPTNLRACTHTHDLSLYYYSPPVVQYTVMLGLVCDMDIRFWRYWTTIVCRNENDMN
jgi:hypothetical protein